MGVFSWIFTSRFRVGLSQVYKILKYVETYQRENKLSHMPIILCGYVSCSMVSCITFENEHPHFCTSLFALFRDWNGSKRGHVYKFLRSQGFVSSYDMAHQYTDSDADAHKVSFSYSSLNV